MQHVGNEVVPVPLVFCMLHDLLSTADQGQTGIWRIATMPPHVLEHLHDFSGTATPPSVEATAGK